MAIRQFRNTQGITDRNSLSVNNYLREVSRYPMISMEEEAHLAQEIRRGGSGAMKARQRLVEANLRFVISVANQYRLKNMELADLISEGNIGLIKAAERFDDTRGFKFISFAVWWIRQSIMAAIADQGRTVRIPQNKHALMQQYQMLLHETMQTEQRMPTVEEFAMFADIDQKKAQHVMQMSTTTISTDTPLGDDSDTTIGDMFASESCTDSTLERESLQTDILTLMDHTLNTREQEVVRRSFGIEGKEQSLEDISLEMGLSRERVRQIREMAVGKMKCCGDSHLLYKYLG